MTSLWEYANPRKFMTASRAALPWVAGMAAFCLLIGLAWGLFFTRDADLHGSGVKMLFVHVPAAMMAVNAWFMMLVTSLIWLIRRHHVSALAAKAAAPVGLIFALLAMLTGALWGQPAWGSWWVWEPRLTSFLVLLFFYVGYIALWEAVEDPDTAADLTAILCLVGTVFAVISRYAILFWNYGQHQGATLSLDREQNIHNEYWYPILITIAGFVLFFVALVLLRTRTEIRLRRVHAIVAREGSV